ncbi:MAG: hypothetical protein MR613_08545 [Prevotella sp.]|nr:hypothetical protein [Prevotella sp.]
MSIFYLNGSNDLATVPISAIYIRLLVKQLFSFAKIQQFVGYTKKSIFFNDRGRQRLFKSFQKAFNKLSKGAQRAFQSMFFSYSSMSCPCEKMYKYAKRKEEMNKYLKTRL